VAVTLAEGDDGPEWIDEPVVAHHAIPSPQAATLPPQAAPVQQPCKDPQWL
jgi:hypothetical protein